MAELLWKGHWITIVHFTTGNDGGRYGDRTPGVFVHLFDRKMLFDSAVNGVSTYRHQFLGSQLEHKYKIEIHQRYVSRGDYRFFIKVDGIEIHSVINSDARQFYNVKVYAGDPWRETNGFISNLKLTNFL